MVFTSLTGKLYLTSGGRVTLDDHGCEAYSEPYDAVLMTKEELTSGISIKDFAKRLERAEKARIRRFKK